MLLIEYWLITSENEGKGMSFILREGIGGLYNASGGSIEGEK
jgi:hypothetical protein